MPLALLVVAVLASGGPHARGKPHAPVYLPNSTVTIRQAKTGRLVARSGEHITAGRFKIRLRPGLYSIQANALPLLPNERCERQTVRIRKAQRRLTVELSCPIRYPQG
jgi:hypothetical protein